MASLLRPADDLTPLHSAAQRGYFEVAEFLISKGADVNARTHRTRCLCRPAPAHFAELPLLCADDETALEFASEGGYVDIVKLLIEKDADVHAKTHGGKTALHGAVVQKRDEVVNILLVRSQPY